MHLSGQLGSGSLTEVLSPPTSASSYVLPSQVTSLSAGAEHACAVHSGAIKCWGANNLGQLGDGTSTQRTSPVASQPLGGTARQVSAGLGHTCAVTTAGGAYCWGNNGNNQLGDGTGTLSRNPVAVSGLSSGIASITTADAHSCALATDGAVRCWGYNNFGSIGDGTTTQRSTPVLVSGLTAQSLSANGYTTCAVNTVGAAYCWGYNGYSQLGDGTDTDRSTPTPVAILSSGVAKISVGRYHTCALTTAGAAKCWGDNSYGQLGDGTTTARSTPVDVSGLTSGVAEISAGFHFTCARLSDGTKRCWGNNTSGQIGNGERNGKLTPADVSSLGTSVIGVGRDSVATPGSFTQHRCGITTGGSVKCWGRNSYGQIGDGTYTSRLSPTQVSSLTANATILTTGAYHTCAVISGGLKCWGYNGSGQLGIGSSYSDATSPTNVPGLTSSVTDVSGNVSNTCAIVSGAAKCWGFNFFGQIGDGTTSQRFDPTSVLTLTSGMTKIATSGMHTCAASSANNVYCWGGNGTGQLGDGTQTLKRVPTTLASPLDTTTVASLALGGSHTCAVTSSGALYCWGSNSFGQVGDGSTTDRSSPTLILSSGVSKVSAAGGSTCALMTTGNLKCWGSNQYGELGINPASTLTPTTVIGGSL